MDGRALQRRAAVRTDELPASVLTRAVRVRLGRAVGLRKVFMLQSSGLFDPRGDPAAGLTLG
ncbi:hypothetical protein GCM10027418_12180 [Mariniluteicoccus endophyticus]